MTRRDGVLRCRLLWRIAILFQLLLPVTGVYAQNKSKQKLPPVRIGVPQPSPQQFPNSSVFPGGAEAATESIPSQASKQPSSSNAPQKGEFIVAPIPFSNEAFSFAIVPFVQYVFQPDKAAKSSAQSSVVLTGLIATRSSWAGGGGGRFYLKDRYRVTAFGGHGSIGYDTFGVGNEGGDKGEALAIRQGGTWYCSSFLFAPWARSISGRDSTIGIFRQAWIPKERALRYPLVWIRQNWE